MNKIDREALLDFMADCEQDNTNTLDDYQRIASGSAIYPGAGSILGLAYCALKLNGEAGELAEHVGKAMRDDGVINARVNAPDDLGYRKGEVVLCPLNPIKRELIVKECGDVLWYVAAIARELNMSLSEIAAENLNKLADRQSRGKLGGSGDNR